jgi:hypothetical protein
MVRPFSLRSLLAPVLLSAWLSLPAAAATFTVNRMDDVNLSGGLGCPADCTLRAAINAANAAPGEDVVEIPPGVYLLDPSFFFRRLVITDDIRILGAGASSTVIDAQQGDQVFHVDGVKAFFSDVTIRGGNATTGVTHTGAGIENTEGNVTIVNSILTDNIAAESGSAIHNSGGTLIVKNTLITKNSSQDGQAIANTGIATIEDSVLKDNEGGALSNDSLHIDTPPAELSLLRSTVINNVGRSIIDNGTHLAASLTIRDSSIVLNHANGSGGGLLNDQYGTSFIINSTISSNQSDQSGGAIANSGQLDIVNSTIVDADGTPSGNASVYFFGNPATTISNSMITGDCLRQFSSVTPGFESHGGNIESAGNTCGLSDPTDQVNVADPLIGPLADNGGPTQTHALLPGSPAIDSAVDANCPDADQRGAPRNVGPCDVGAFEFGAQPEPELQISKVTPDRGGDIGQVTVTVVGSGFGNSATVALQRTGELDIAGDPVTVAADGTTLVTTFDLVGATRGLWDVVVTNPDGATFTLPGGFAVEEGRPPELWVDIIGRDVIRPERQQTYWIAVGNRGNVDASGVPIWIEYPDNLEITPGFDVLSPITIPDGIPVDESNISKEFLLDDRVNLPLVIARLPGGVVQVFEFSMTVPRDIDPFVVRAWLNPPLIDRFGNVRHELIECVLDSMELVLSTLPKPEQEFAECISTAARPSIEDFITREKSESTDAPSLLSELQFLGGWISNGIRQCLKTESEPLEKAKDALGKILSFGNPISSCTNAFRHPLFGPSPAELLFGPLLSSMHIGPVASFDPNNKIGGRGEGSQMYLSSMEPTRFAIFFDNLETATAAAQEVQVTDQLDAGHLDLSSLSFGAVTFGGQLVTPPPGLGQFSTEVDLRPGKDLIVRIEAGLDRATGIVTWRFTSIDPATGQPPEDPLAGFLPPNVNPPEGEGSVLFTVQPKAGLATGTEIDNDATIVFDNNDPIRTPVWFNTIDNSNPTSAVQPLASVQQTVSFPVAWSGQDEGAGVRDFSVFVSEDGGPCQPWLVDTPDTSANFVGEDGKSYAFYSKARDLTGNVEDKAPVAEAQTLVQLPPADRDGDGVPDDHDACPDSIVTATVVIDQCDSGVPNTIIEDGCTISDRIAQWGADAKNHGLFVSQVADLTSRLRNNGIITGKQKGAIQSCAAQANLP